MRRARRLRSFDPTPCRPWTRAAQARPSPSRHLDHRTSRGRSGRPASTVDVRPRFVAPDPRSPRGDPAAPRRLRLGPVTAPRQSWRGTAPSEPTSGSLCPSPTINRRPPPRSRRVPQRLRRCLQLRHGRRARPRRVDRGGPEANGDRRADFTRSTDACRRGDLRRRSPCPPGSRTRSRSGRPLRAMDQLSSLRGSWAGGKGSSGLAFDLAIPARNRTPPIADRRPRCMSPGAGGRNVATARWLDCPRVVRRAGAGCGRTGCPSTQGATRGCPRRPPAAPCPLTRTRSSPRRPW